jgi:hypothetical protein
VLGAPSAGTAVDESTATVELGVTAQHKAALAHSAEESLSQSLQLLTVAVSGALAIGKTDVVERAAFEVADLLGACTPANSQKAADYLALYQSCRARRRLESLSASMLPHPTLSARKLSKNATGTGAAGSWSVCDDNPCLVLHADAADSAHKLPHGVRCLLIQPNEGCDALYGAVLRSDTNAQATVSCKVAVDKAAIHAIHESLAAFTAFRETAIADAAAAAAATAAAAAGITSESINSSEVPLSSVPGDTAAAAPAAATVEAATEADGEMLAAASAESEQSTMLRGILAKMEAVFSPLLDKLLPSLIGSHDSGVHIVVLADEALFPLPFELLTALQDPRLGSVTRDFSVEIFRRRLAVTAGDEVVGKKGSGKKGSAIEPVVARSSAVTFAVDPRVAFSGQRGNATDFDERFDEMAKDVPGRSDWVSATPSDAGAVSAGHFHSSLKDADVFLQFGPGTLLGELSTSITRAMPLSNCKAALLFDRCLTEQVRGSHATSDSESFGEVFALAGLLTLQGALMVGLNQWVSTTEENEARGKAVLEHSGASQSGCIGTAIHQFRIGVDPDATPIGGNGKKADKVAKKAAVVVAVDTPPPDLPRNFNFTTFGLPHISID